LAHLLVVLFHLATEFVGIFCSPRIRLRPFLVSPAGVYVKFLLALLKFEMKKIEKNYSASQSHLFCVLPALFRRHFASTLLICFLPPLFGHCLQSLFKLYSIANLSILLLEAVVYGVHCA
jgi:hypothetical protein